MWLDSKVLIRNASAKVWGESGVGEPMDPKRVVQDDAEDLL